MSKSLPNWIKELQFLKSLPDEHCKVYKSILWCHGPQQLFVCGANHVVLVPEDGTPRCMSMTSRILFRAYGSSTICKIKVKRHTPESRVCCHMSYAYDSLLVHRGSSRHFSYSNCKLYPWYKYQVLVLVRKRDLYEISDMVIISSSDARVRVPSPQHETELNTRN